MLQAQCDVFLTTYNPEGIRTGNKILRQRLKGPSLAAYYPKKMLKFRDFQEEFGQLELLIEDDSEIARLEHVAACVFVFNTPPYMSQPSDNLQSQSSRERSTQEEVRATGYVHILFGYSTEPSSDTVSQIRRLARRRNNTAKRRTAATIRHVLLFYRAKKKYTPSLSTRHAALCLPPRECVLYPHSTAPCYSTVSSDLCADLRGLVFNTTIFPIPTTKHHKCS